MSTDRELLEAAAKAAGCHFHGHRVGLGYANCYVSKTGDSDDWFVWSPITDDADAFRLAVALKIEIGWDAFQDADVMVSHDDQWWTEPYGTDPAAATRRAIVRAAAALGSNG